MVIQVDWMSTTIIHNGEWLRRCRCNVIVHMEGVDNVCVDMVYVDRIVLQVDWMSTTIIHNGEWLRRCRCNVIVHMEGVDNVCVDMVYVDRNRDWRGETVTEFRAHPRRIPSSPKMNPELIHSDS
ncbi:hypothetical protein F2Q69_00054025 [Brassica cretica]|uniref:Uncharacterized protein n=1 Tax=Brassica cretica TaxID=69181 RepID=A0A8S9MLU4_BRACR|nr:hypothetical protein F2Q69_00054025 [Brassica cretica]